jgi:hypothetical protein
MGRLLQLVGIVTACQFFAAACGSCHSKLSSCYSLCQLSQQVNPLLQPVPAVTECQSFAAACGRCHSKLSSCCCLWRCHSKLTPCCNLWQLSHHANLLLQLVAAVAPEVNIFNAATLEVHGSSRHRLNFIKSVLVHLLFYFCR